MAWSRKRRIAAGVAVAVLLAMAVGWWLLLRGSYPKFAKRDPARRVDRAFRLLRSPDATNELPAGPSWLVEPGVADRRIAGVVRSDGRPVPGARVQLRSEHISLGGGATPEQTTNSDGAFDFGERPAASYAVIATADGYRFGGRRVNLRDPKHDPRPDEVVIVLSKCSDYAFGVVHDVYGGLVVDGTVSVAAKIDESSGFDELFDKPIDEDGSFALCRPKNHQMIWVTAPGYGTVWLREPMPPGGWDVRLFPEGSVEGKVVDDVGQPVDGARVVLMKDSVGATGFSAPIAQKVASGTDGSFRFTGVAPGQFQLAADHGRYATNLAWPTVTVAPGSSVAGVVLTMKRCRGLAGVVLRADEPVVGVRVGPNYEAFTQADGTFVIGCAEPGQLEFKVQQYDVLEPGIPAGESDIDDLVIRVKARATIAGRVTADGVPVAGAIVAIGDPSAGVGMMSVFGEHYRARTDDAGAYALLGVPAGTHEINAWDPESQRRSQPLSVDVGQGSQLQDVDLELEHAAAVGGVVVDPVGTPVPNVEVHLLGGTPPSAHASSMRFSADDVFTASTDESGAFRVAGLVQGSYEVCLGWCFSRKTDPRYLPLEGDAWPSIEVPTSQTDVDVRLVVRSKAGLSIRGHVRYDNGPAVPYAVVRASVAGVDATADERGAFLLAGLLEGDYDLEAIAQDGSTGEVKAVGTDAEAVTIVVQRVGAIRGSVTGGSGDCTVKAVDAELSSLGISPLFGGHVATATRAFAFPAVTPGDYRVEARCAEGVVARRVTVEPGKTVTVDLQAGDSGSVNGTVRHFPSGEPASPATCFGGTATTEVAPSGEFELTGMLPGPTHIICGTMNGDTVSTGIADVNVTSGGSVVAEVFVVEGDIPIELGNLPGKKNRLGASLEYVPGAAPATLAFTDVLPSGPAATAGIREGDLLVSVDGAAAVGAASAAAKSYVESRRGTEVLLEVNRNGTTLTVTLALN